MATLGDSIVGRRLQRKRPKATALACARTLRLIGTDKAREALGFYRATDQQEIAEELAQLFHPLALPFWQNWIQKEYSLPESVLPGVTDLAPLQGLASLQTLWLNGTGVTDLAPLQGLASLQALSLNGTKVEDVSVLDHIEGLEIFR
ncbi:MAG: leucine-rich repeat domain-containing protein [Geminicoccaceae bacterium]